ncbi:hypothetical protein PMAYCL1PPCAC_12495, partial [Pristionchus mayeri]
MLVLLHSSNGLIPRTCILIGADDNKWLNKPKCYYCSRTQIVYMESIADWKVISEEAGCADDVNLEETPPGLDCASHLGSNSSGRGSDFVMYYTQRGDTELVARRCCENFDGECNRPFQVKYPQKYMLRHVKRFPPKVMGIVIVVAIFLLYYIFRIYYASRADHQMSLDVTKKEQMKMFGYRDDPLEVAIIENRVKVVEPGEAQMKTRLFPTFNDAVKIITDIQYISNRKKLDNMWTAALPKMRRDAEKLGYRKPSEIPPLRTKPIFDLTGQSFYELKKNHSHPLGIFSSIVKHQTQSSKISKTQNRPIPSCLPDLLLKLIEHGPYEYPFKAAELFHIFEKAKDLFANDQTVIPLKNNQIVIGDIRGRYVDLFRYFNAFGWPPQRSYLFLGGIIENEEDQSVECMALLAALKTAMPENIFILRGVGETIPYVPGRRFPGIKGEVIGNSLARLCNQLPLAAVINQKIVCTHSGVTTHFKGKSKLNNVQRPFTMEDMSEAARRIIFAVPETNCRMFRMRPHEKNGEVFGSKAVQKTLANMKLDLLIRSRSPITEGYALHWEKNVLSIWSALSHGITRAAAVEVDGTCHITLHLLDTTAQLCEKKMRVQTNVVKATGDEQEEEDEDDAEREDGPPDQGESSSGKKVKDGNEAEQSKEASAKGKATVEDIKESTASAKSAEKRKELNGGSREKTAMKDSKDSKENTKGDAENDEGVLKTQDSLSARATELPFSDSAMEQKTQSFKEAIKEAVKAGHEDSKKKGKKKEEVGGKDKEKEKENVELKTPDMSIKSEKSMMQAATPAKDCGVSGKKKKIEEKELDDAILKSKYEDAIPLKVKNEEWKKDKQIESVMRDVSTRRKEGAEKEQKAPMDSLREGVKADEKTKKKSNETLNEGPSKETDRESHPKDEYAFSEKSMGSKTHKVAKKMKKEEKKEKEEKEEKKEKMEEKKEKEEKEDKKEKEEKEDKKEK